MAATKDPLDLVMAVDEAWTALARRVMETRDLAAIEAARTYQRAVAALPALSAKHHTGGRLALNQRRDLEIRQRYKAGDTADTLAFEFGISRMRIWQICKNVARERRPEQS